MTATKIDDVELRSFEPDNQTSTPAHTVPQADIKSVTLTQRIQDLIDTGKLTVRNDGGQWTDALTTGNRIELRTQLRGGSMTQRWTGLIRPITRSQRAPGQMDITVTADDFVFGVLDIRRVVNGFDGRQISGSSSAILETILSNNAPEILQNQIGTVSGTPAVIWNGKSLLEAVSELADRGDAIVTSDDRSLVFRELGSAPVEWSLQNSDTGLLSVRENDDKLQNQIRVQGGQGVQVDDEQTTHDGTTTVSASSRAQIHLSTRKADVAQVELWTDPTGSGEGIVVRLQSDDGGAPTAPTSRKSDLATKTLAADFFDDPGWTTFILPENSLANPNPWLLVETDGNSGQDVGVDSSSGDLAYRAYYSYPLDTQAIDQQSIDDYRRREHIEPDNALQTRDQTIDVAKALLRHRTEPKRTVTFEAVSARAHDLSTGDVIAIDKPALQFSGDAIVTQIEDEFGGGSSIRRTVTCQTADSI